MKYSEELWWILDHERRSYQENIDFVHSLGLKCDCVGWCKMKLKSPETEKILREIDSFCKEEGWHARGMYYREYTDVVSDWYELVTVDIKVSNKDCGCIYTSSESGENVEVRKIRACNEPSVGLKEYLEHILVPERFRKVCLEQGIPGIDFCWAQDKGKYAAEQYYHLYVDRQIPHLAVGWELSRASTNIKTGKHRDAIEAVGGYLPEICDVFYEMQQINLQDCYIAADMPEGGIASAYIPKSYSSYVRRKILIHKDIAEILVREKALSPAALRPAPVFGTIPAGYKLYPTTPLPRPTGEFVAKMDEACEKLKAAGRPVKAISEKDALRVMRRAKSERKEAFQKRLPKAKLEALEATDYAALAPYYYVADGGLLSDEYELFSHERAVAENMEFQLELEAEELLEEKPEGVVIAGCADGDRVLLCKDGRVIRFSHEAPEVTEEWSSLAQFVFDTVTEAE